MINRWRRVAFPVLALAAILLLASTLSSVINPVLVAVLLAVILNPVVNVAGRFGLPRVASVTVLYVVLLLVLVLFASVLGRQFQELGRALAGEPFHADSNGNGLIELAGQPLGRQPVEVDEFDDLNGSGAYDAGALLRLENWLNRQLATGGSGVLGETYDTVRTQVLGGLGDIARPASEMIARGVDYVTEWAGGLWQALTLLVLIPFYLFFFLVEYPAMSRKLRDLVPPRYRAQVDRITRDIGRELVTFLRGRLACGAVKALLLWIGMFVLDIEFALPIALVSGLLSLIPVLGFVAGVVPAAVIALTMPGGGTETLLWVLAVFVTGEVVEGAVLFPLLLGKETGLHPVTLVVVLLAGGALMGTLGLIVAIPLSLVIKVLWRELGQPLYKAWAHPPAEAGSLALPGGPPRDGEGRAGAS